MDQRNAGRSQGPLEVSDPWGSYAEDHLALLDHLGVERCQVVGCCIGGSFALKLVERAPERVAAAVLEQPIGRTPQNRHLFEDLWRDWGADLVASGRMELTPEHLEAFGTKMWDGDFVVSVERDVVARCPTPLLVLPGIDDYHPTETGREIARLAPAAEVVEPWKDTPAHLAEATEAVRRFLHTHGGRP
jgi:pimeloyl-ACP methyl ester carboxylesterase